MNRDSAQLGDYYVCQLSTKDERGQTLGARYWVKHDVNNSRYGPSYTAFVQMTFDDRPGGRLIVSKGWNSEGAALLRADRLIFAYADLHKKFYAS